MPADAEEDHHRQVHDHAALHDEVHHQVPDAHAHGQQLYVLLHHELRELRELRVRLLLHLYYLLRVLELQLRRVHERWWRDHAVRGHAASQLARNVAEDVQVVHAVRLVLWRCVTDAFCSFRYWHWDCMRA